MATTSLFFDIFARDMNAKETFAGIEAAGVGMGRGLGRMLAPLGVGLAGLGIADLVGHMVKAAGDFEAANTRLATSAGESVQNLKMVGDGILNVAQDTGTATDQLEKAAYYIESAGYHGADMLTVLKAAAQGAKAEGSDVATVGDAVTSALRDYHLSASDAADVTSKMITAVSDGKTTFELFTGSLHSVLPVAAAAHISMDDILGDLASMTVHGMSADQATQDLNHTIFKLINPTQQETSEFALFGTTAQEVQGKLGTSGLSGTLDFLHDKIVSAMPPGSDKVLLDFKNAAAATEPAVQKYAAQLADGTISTKQFIAELKAGTPLEYEQGKALLALLGSTHKLGTEQMSGEQVLQNYTQAWRLLTGDQTGAATALMLTGENADYTHKAINDVSKASKDAQGNVKGWSEVQDTFNNKLDRFKETIGVIGIKIGEKLLPALGDALNGFTDFFNRVGPLIPALWDKDIAPALESIGKSLLGTLGDAPGDASGDAADGFGRAMDKVGTNADGTMGANGTVARVAKEFGQSMTEISDSIKSVTDTFSTLDTITNNVLNAVQQNAEQTRAQLVAQFQQIADWVNQAVSAFQTAESWVETNFGGNWLTEGWQAGNNLIQGVIDGIAHAAGDLLNAVGSLGQQAVDALNSALGNHSPSVKGHAAGVNLGLGLIQGLDSMHGGTHDAMGRLGSIVTHGMRDMTSHMTGGASPFMASAPAIYVQNPWTGEYLLAKVDQRAGAAIDAADHRFVRRPSR